MGDALEAAHGRRSIAAVMTLNAPAKVNLVLEVLARRDDYHEISSILQPVDLFDTLTFEHAREIEFSCTESTLLPDNLVKRAAHAMRHACGVRKGARIHLEKRIPWAAGLGGGSSDAAAALRGLNVLWQTGLSTDRLVELARSLGSDVPAFIHGGTVLVSGRGDKVAAAPPLARTHLVVLVPDVQVPAEKTGTLYNSLQPRVFTDGRHTGNAVESLHGSGCVPDVLLFNVFETVMNDCFPGIEREAERLRAVSGSEVHLAGSGPALFVRFETVEQATFAAATLQQERARVYVVESIDTDDARLMLRAT